MTDPTLEYETRDHVGIVTIDRPPVNALRYEDLDAMADLLEDLPADGELAVVLSGNGDRAFVAGHDVKEFADAPAAVHEAGTETYARLAESLYGCPVPTIAAVDGPALGTGMVIAALCDVRIASPDAAFGLPEIDVGVVAGFGLAGRIFPGGVARNMVYTGNPISGERAYDLGAASVLADDPTVAAIERAKDIAAKSPDAVLAAKRLLIEQQSDRPLARLRSERETSEALLRRPNAREAVRSFLEDREPDFER